MEIKTKGEVEIEVNDDNDVNLEVNDTNAIILRNPNWGEIEGDINNQSDLIKLFNKEEQQRKLLSKSIERYRLNNKKVFEVLNPDDVIYTFKHNLSSKDLLINVYSIYGIDLYPSIKRDYDSVTIAFDRVPSPFRVVILRVNKYGLDNMQFTLPIK